MEGLYVKSWEAIRDAWAPYVGERIAEERARNAALVLQGHSPPSRRKTRRALCRSLVMATTPLYGGVRLTAATVLEAVDAAAEALSVV
jgi:hypothetical protein